MSFKSRAGSAAIKAHWAVLGQLKAMLPTLGLAVLVSGCSGLPSAPLAGPDPADSSVPVASVGYRSTIGSYTRQRPVEPAPWREQNERVAPSPRQ